MITVKQDSELMKNYIAADPVPAGERFAVFKDDDQEPAVLALGEDSRLNLIMVHNGTTSSFDFGVITGVAKEGVKAQAFALTQASDLTLDICVATESTTTGKSDFWLLYNVKPSALLSVTPTFKMVTGDYFPTVRHIFMSKRATDNSTLLPAVMVAFERPDRIGSTEDLRYIEYNSDKATLSSAWSLATNPQKILDVAMISTDMGDAAVVLYEGFDTPAILQTKFFSGDLQGMVCEPHCPTEASCLATFHDSKGQSVVLIGGKGVYAFPRSDYISSRGKGTVIHTEDRLPLIKNMEASQTGDDLRFWYTTENDAVHYYRTTASSLENGQLIPLLNKGQGGRISGMLSVRNREGQGQALSSSLMSVDESGNLSLLQQDPATRLWQSYPFFHASKENVIEVNGFSLRMHVVIENDSSTDNDSTTLIPGCQLLVSCSGLVRCTVNGRHVTLSQDAQWFRCDAHGVLNIMLQTDDASCHQFSAEQFRSSDGKTQRSLTQPVLDPSRKLAAKLGGVSTDDDLRALKKSDGTPLVPSNASDDDVKAAVHSIGVMTDQLKQQHQDTAARSQMFVAMVDIQGVAEPPPAVGFPTWDEFVDGVNAAFHSIENVFEDVVKWGCDFITDAAGKVWKFIVHIGEEIFELLLDSVTAIVKGLVWIFKKIGAILQDIIDFLGYIFGWGDILATADSLSTSFNVALDYGESSIDNLETKVDSWLEQARSTIKEQLPNLQKNDYQKGPVLQASAEPPQALGTEDDEDANDIKKSVAYNWGTCQFTYGGGASNSSFKDVAPLASAGGSDDPEQVLIQLWDDIAKELVTLTNLGLTFGKDLIPFLSKGNFDIQEILTKIATDTVDGMIDALKTLADILVKGVTLGIGVVRSIANREIDIPVITWLWSHVIAPGRPLTLLNACALLIAIPTTVLYKATAKCAPPKLADRLNSTTFGQYLGGTGDASLGKDIARFNLASASGIEAICGTFDTLSLAADGVFEGLGLESVHIEFVDNIMAVFDYAALVFEGMGTFSSWPVEDSDSAAASASSFDLDKFCSYSKWGLQVANKAALVIATLAAKAKKADRPVSKRFRGALAAVVSVPTLCVALTKDINDANKGEEKTEIITNHFFEDALEFCGQLGFAVASWNDEAENEIMYAGLAVMQVCALSNAGFKVEDFGLEIAG